MVLGLAMSAQARDSYSRDASVLPQGARTTLSKCFKGKVSLVKIDKTLGHINDYEVVLTDGTEVEFDAKGNWKSVETSIKSSVPSSLLPKSIISYVGKNHKGQKIVGAEKKGSKYEIELSNGLDLEFSLNGDFVKYD